MDRFAAELLNILIPANQVEEAMENVRDVMSMADVDHELDDNLLKAELYVANISQQNIPLSIKIVSNISKLIYGKMYSWAGQINPQNRALVEKVLERIVKQWDYSLIDEEVRLELLAYSYHGLVKSKPFFDGNERVARVFVNYLALKQNLPIFSLAPSKKDIKSYRKYIKTLKSADNGDLIPLKEHIRETLNLSSNGSSKVGLGPSATVSD
jgi:fido (protein-threonine AMPylation protein)